MIDWWGVGTGALWISGLATLLATISYCDWLGAQKGQSLRSVMSEFVPALFLNLGLFLFCLGLLATSSQWLERVGWGIALLLIVAQMFGDYWQRRKMRLGAEGE